MAIITEVRFAHEHGALADTLNALSDVDVAVVREARTDPEHDVYVIRFEGGDLQEIKEVLAADHTVHDVDPMPGFEDQKLLGIQFTPETMLLNPEVTREDGFVIEAKGSPVGGGKRGWHERWLLPDEESLRGIWEYARERGFDFEVFELHQHERDNSDFRRSDIVTEQQREALTAAFEGGYFTEPREMSLEELADELDLSSTASAGRLRRGMKSLIGATLVVDGEER
ncbi:MAG: helix-turn-helix domain-containing protein [Halobacteriales archaeon]